MVKLMDYADKDDKYVAGIFVDFHVKFDSLKWPVIFTQLVVM